MNEISFEDILTHYYLKLKEVFDETERIKIASTKVASLADESWKGTASDVFQEKMLLLNGELDKTKLEISEALKKLSAISEEL